MKTAAALILLATITHAQPAPKENPPGSFPLDPSLLAKMTRASAAPSLSRALSSIRPGHQRSSCLRSWSLLCASFSLLPPTLSDMEQELRESVTMVAACSAHPARISQLLLHPHPGMKHQLGAVRIAAVLSPSLSSLMERMRRNTQSVLLMSLGFTPLSRAKLLPVQDRAAFSSLRTNSNTKENQQKFVETLMFWK